MARFMRRTLFSLAVAGALLGAPAVSLADVQGPPAPGAGGPADPMALRIRQGFADSIYGQVHYLTAQPDAGLPKTKWKTPLVMFHQSPLSAREFGPLIAEMAKDRVVIALDTPGQGLSDGPDRPVAIAEFGIVMGKALTAMGYGPSHPVDVFGNHTGVWVGSELAIRYPKMVRKIVFDGVYVVPEEAWRAAIARLTLQDSNEAFFETMKTYLTASRTRYQANGMSDADWGRMIVDTLTPRQRREYGHVSAFAYAADAPTRLPLITQPVTLLLIDDGIAEKTRAAAPLFKHLTGIVERMTWREGLFYTRPAEVASVLRGALD